MFEEAELHRQLGSIDPKSFRTDRPPLQNKYHDITFCAPDGSSTWILMTHAGLGFGPELTEVVTGQAATGS